MTTDIPSRLGNLQLKDAARKLAQAETVAHRPDDAADAMKVAPAAFDRTLSLSERFIDLGEISRGGMASIRRVNERNLSRQVAMKVMHIDLDEHEELRYRFIKEAQITGQLEHPHIVPVYELGADDQGTHFFTMKLVKGKTLKNFVHDTRHARPDDYLYDALQAFLKVCDALAFAHGRGVVHRDIKPSNIMIGNHGQVYLMDWGVAYLLRNQPASGNGGRLSNVLEQRRDLPGTLLGTYSFMSPEQAHGLVDSIDERSDIFSLGAVLYYILTLQPPYRGENSQQVLVKAQQCRFPHPEEVDDGCPSPLLAQVVMKAMAPDPADRYQRVADLKRDAEAVLRGRWRYPVVRFADGEVILEEGQVGNEAYVIRSGRCEVYRTLDGRKMHLANLGPGAFFGETAVFTGMQRTASIRAVGDVELWVVAGRTIKQELKLETWMGGFVSAMGQRFSESSDTLTRLQEQVAHDQILKEVLMHFARHGEANRAGERVVSWPALMEAVGKPFRCGQKMLLQVIESEPFFRVDRSGNRVTSATLLS